MSNFDFYFFIKPYLTHKNIYLVFIVVIILIASFAFYAVSKAEQVNSANLTFDPENELFDQELTKEHNGEIYVDIGGAVKNPGIYKLKKGSRLADLLHVSGGADTQTIAAPWFLKNFNLSKTLIDEQKIYIPFEWEVYESTQTIADLSKLQLPDDTYIAGSTALKEMSNNDSINEVETSTTSKSQETNGKINVNFASQDQLEGLPGIGEAYALKIIQNRPYESLEELKTKAKLSDSLLKKIENEIIF